MFTAKCTESTETQGYSNETQILQAKRCNICKSNYPTAKAVGMRLRFQKRSAVIFASRIIPQRDGIVMSNGENAM